MVTLINLIENKTLRPTPKCSDKNKRTVNISEQIKSNVTGHLANLIRLLMLFTNIE